MKKLLKKLIPDFILYWYHWKLAFLGALIFGWPSRKLKVIGVTGTKGKSTVVMLAGKILAEVNNPSISSGNNNKKFSTSSNNKAAIGWISSLTINDGKNEVMNPYHMTMPGRMFIQKTLAQMEKNGCEYALVEVTSEGIKQSRHRFINWAGAVFTNLAPEHLETHGGFENYRLAKIKLFEAAAKNKESFGVYNLDDKNVDYFLAPAIKNKYGFTLSPSISLGNNFSTSSKNKNLLFEQSAESAASRTIYVKNIRLSPSGSEFEISGTKFYTNLLGEFNVYNCAIAVAIGQACGVSLEVAKAALAKIDGIPGRLEQINESQDFTVVVDLAHTPDSFEKVFKLFSGLRDSSSPQMRGGLRWGDEKEKEDNTSPDPFPDQVEDRISTAEGGVRVKIISVFGSAGGGRDKWKRPELGRIACQYSDQVFITNEDPYDEDPLEITNEILSGCDQSKTDIILDRREAIARALFLAKTGDIVLILGKGTEQTMVIGKKHLVWDDRLVAREELRKRRN